MTSCRRMLPTLDSSSDGSRSIGDDGSTTSRRRPSTSSKLKLTSTKSQILIEVGDKFRSLQEAQPASGGVEGNPIPSDILLGVRRERGPRRAPRLRLLG